VKHTTWRSKLLFLAVPVAGLFLTLGVPNARADEDKKTARLFKAKCASCHGEDGKGATEQGKKMGIGDMTNAAYWKDVDDAKFEKILNEGIKRKKDGKDQDMKAFKDSLKPEEIKALRAFTKTFIK